MDQSWDWLAPRSFVQLPERSQSAPSVRPCLPAVETLGDRVLLSAAPASVGGDQIPPGPCLVADVNGVIGQPQSTSSIAVDEIQIQKQIDKSTPTLLLAVTNEFIKMNDLFGFADGALVIGTANPALMKYIQGAVGDEFLKIDTLLGVGGVTADATTGGTGLLPAVQKLQSDSDGLLTTLSGLAPGSGGASLKVDFQYLALDAAFTDLANNLVLTSSDVILHKASVAVDYLKYKLDEVIISSLMPSDPSVQQPLEGAEMEADSILIGLLQPSTVGTDPTVGT